MISILCHTVLTHPYYLITVITFHGWLPNLPVWHNNSTLMSYGRLCNPPVWHRHTVAFPCWWLVWYKHRCYPHDDVIKWKHFSRNWPFVREIHRSPVNFPHKGQWRGALMFSLIYAWIKDWVNNREAGDLRRQHGHYDVIVMPYGWYCLMLMTCNSNIQTSRHSFAGGKLHLGRTQEELTVSSWVAPITRIHDQTLLKTIKRHAVRATGVVKILIVDISINPLGFGGAIWRHGSRSTLVQ